MEIILFTKKELFTKQSADHSITAALSLNCEFVQFWLI